MMESYWNRGKLVPLRPMAGAAWCHLLSAAKSVSDRLVNVHYTGASQIVGNNNRGTQLWG